MLPQWRTAPSDAGTAAPSESVYSQPSLPRHSGLRPFLLPHRISRSSRNTDNLPSSPQSTVSRISAVPPNLPPIRFDGTSAASPTSRSPTSVRSVIDPGLSPFAQGQRPLSAVTFSSSTESAPLQAPARVLDYGGNVSLDSAHAPTGRRFGSNRRQGSSRSNRSFRSNRSVGNVRSYEERSRAQTSTRSRTRRGPRWIPKHSKGRVFFPAMKHSAIRTKFFHALVSGGLLVTILIVFLALIGSDAAFTQEFRIIAILFMLVFVVLFAHSVIRLLMLMHKYKKRGALGRHPSLNDQSTYVRPSQPIPIVLARDEELGIGGSPLAGSEDLPKPPPPPPVYGLWRGSVRVDPNLIHWQRVQDTAKNGRPLSSETIHLPPEYPPDGRDPNIGLDEQIEQERAEAAARLRSEEATSWNPRPLRPPPQV